MRTKATVTRTYRLDVDVERRLRELAAETRRSMTATLEVAVMEMYRRVMEEESAGRVAR